MNNYEECRQQWEDSHFIGYPEKKIYRPVISNGSSLCNCYHYTTLNNFWSMVASDVFYARHVRFSNDSEEYQLGSKIVNDILGADNDIQRDFYMMCFCRKDNLLSQWREYAKGGVCLGFDLEDEGYFTILNNEEAKEELKRQAGDKTVSENELRYGIPENSWTNKIKYSYAYAKPLQVFYVGENSKKIRKLYEKIEQIYGVNSEVPEDKNMRLLIPYIKHKGFKEEEEVRLIFQPAPYFHRFQVFYLNDAGVKKPFIKTEVGIAEEKSGNVCKIIFDHMEGFEIEYHRELDDLESNLGVDMRFEYENTNKHSKSQVIIGCCSKQKEIFYWIDKVAERWNLNNPDKKVRVWCKGHLPIREITIGPCQNKEEIAESVSHYIQNVYWLKYAEITCCSIPYREKR